MGGEAVLGGCFPGYPIWVTSVCIERGRCLPDEYSPVFAASPTPVIVDESPS